MKLGVFMMPLHPPGKDLAQIYDEDRELIVLADELGYSEAWIGEHASIAWEPLPAPDQFIARVYPETKQIRFGTGVVLMAQHHPANVANRIAQLDQLTRGRINFGIGVGGIPTDLELFGIDGQLPEIMMFRAIDIILKLWTEDPPYDLPGQFWPIRVTKQWPEIGLGSLIRPYQKPHPPIALPGMSANSRLMYTAGERGWIPMSSNLVHTRFLQGHWPQVSKGAAATGRNPSRSIWRIAREVYVDDTIEAARTYARKGALRRAYEDYFFLTGKKGRMVEMWKARDDLPTSEVDLDYMIDNMWLVGDPDSVARQIRELYHEVGGFGTLLWVTQDWDDPVRWRNSMRLLATEVMPRVADLT
jgi:alkanesulfonate monooxygenase SsuD/methylene tetrahydromethanopterin reductase-like flavin-dependent oxidoreductase (luciferase family)